VKKKTQAGLPSRSPILCSQRPGFLAEVFSFPILQLAPRFGSPEELACVQIRGDRPRPLAAHHDAVRC